MDELKRIIEESEIMQEDDNLWPPPDRVGRQVGGQSLTVSCCIVLQVLTLKILFAVGTGDREIACLFIVLYCKRENVYYSSSAKWKCYISDFLYIHFVYLQCKVSNLHSSMNINVIYTAHVLLAFNCFHNVSI